MIEDQAPNRPLPPAAQPPWPAHPAPRHDEAPTIPVARKSTPPAPAGVGTLGATLIGGAIAAAIGLLVVAPLWRGKAKTVAKKGRGKRKGR